MIVVARIDDRLVHGQVVIGWCRPLEITRIILVDDTVATSDFEQDLYRLAVPDGVAIEFLTEAAAPTRLAEAAADDARSLVLTGSVDAMVNLQRARPNLIQAINLGGIHDQAGRAERLRYIYLSARELSDLSALSATGVSVTAQDLPTTRPIPIQELR
jgi:PTS system mannose-specific IIB component/fructoselysine and glucoselysine-specific PTS system IIB component